MKRWLSAFATVLFLASAADAQACYTAREMEAEQALRIHSELMVIGLTCIKMPQGPELYRKYQRFTSKNARLIAGYEDDLIAYYGREGARSPEQKFHTLRTNIANDVSRRAIQMSTLSFCRTFSPHLDQALTMSPQQIRRWARHVRPEQPTSVPVCARVAEKRSY